MTFYTDAIAEVPDKIELETLATNNIGLPGLRQISYFTY